MKAIPLDIPDIVPIKSKVFGEACALFFESYNQAQFEAAIGKFLQFVQDNYSRSVKNVLCSLYYQIQQLQGKLVRVVQGVVFNIAVDLRKSSKTFDQWVGEILLDKNKRQLWVPEGFAQGFVILRDMAEFHYKTTDYYALAHECCILWNDATLRIQWPAGIQAILSAKDAQGKACTEAEVYA